MIQRLRKGRDKIDYLYGFLYRGQVVLFPSVIDDISKNQFLISASLRKAGEPPQSRFPSKEGEAQNIKPATGSVLA